MRITKKVWVVINLYRGILNECWVFSGETQALAFIALQYGDQGADYVRGYQSNDLVAHCEKYQDDEIHLLETNFEEDIS